MGGVVRSDPGELMFKPVAKDPAYRAALTRVKEWTRERFALPEEAVILVAQVECSLPGCPPLETFVAFWAADDRQHQFKIFKPVAEVVYDDLPFAWLRDALAVEGGFECGCC
jgi:hypothetical protein